MDIRFPEPIQSILKIKPRGIIIFFGGPGTGKTNICIFLTLYCVKNGGKVAYIDSDGDFSVERTKQILGSSLFRNLKFKDVLNSMEIFRPKTLLEQGDVIKSLKDKNFDLIIVDSIATLYRLEYAQTPSYKSELIMNVNRELSRQLSLLSNISKTMDIPVVITSHGYRIWGIKGDKMVGGDVLRYWSEIIIFLERTGKISERKATIIKHKYLKKSLSTKFVIVKNGILPSN